MRTETVQNDSSLIGVGLYSVSEAARYINVAPNTVSNWVSGRKSRSRYDHPDAQKVVLPQRTRSVFVTPPLPVEGKPVLTFAHLMELRMVSLFREQHGVSMPVIKAAAQRLADRFQTGHPFSSIRMKTDGKTIFAEVADRNFVRDAVREETENADTESILEDIGKMQLVMRTIVDVYLQDVDYDLDMASRWWSLGKSSRAVLDPQRALGQPIDNPSGIPLSVLYNMIKAGETVEGVADWYEVTPKAVETAIEFYSKLPRPVTRDTRPNHLRARGN